MRGIGRVPALALPRVAVVLEPERIDGIGPLWKPATVERWAEREWVRGAGGRPSLTE